MFVATQENLCSNVTCHAVPSQLQRIFCAKKNNFATSTLFNAPSKFYCMKNENDLMVYQKVQKVSRSV